MSLRRAPQTTGHGTWLAIIAMGIAAIACVQLLSGAMPLFWLLLACGALWALLVQASRADDTTSVRVHISDGRLRRGRR